MKKRIVGHKEKRIRKRRQKLKKCFSECLAIWSSRFLSPVISIQVSLKQGFRTKPGKKKRAIRRLKRRQRHPAWILAMASIPIGRVIGGHTVTNTTHEPTCHPYETTEAIVLFILSGLGITSNVALILLVCIKKPSKRYHQTWSQGLLLHQGIIDLGRSLLLVYLGISVLICEKLSKCFLIDTAFLLLVSVSTVNMLTMLINDAPIFPEHEQLGSISAAVAGAHRLRVSHSFYSSLILRFLFQRNSFGSFHPLVHLLHSSFFPHFFLVITSIASKDFSWAQTECSRKNGRDDAWRERESESKLNAGLFFTKKFRNRTFDREPQPKTESCFACNPLLWCAFSLNALLSFKQQRTCTTTSMFYAICLTSGRTALNRDVRVHLMRRL